MDIIVKQFEEQEVEIIEIEGQILFNPHNVGEVLEIADVRSSIRDFDEKQVKKITNEMVQKCIAMHDRKLHSTGELFLTESGLYLLILRSRKPQAEKFQNWIANEVLPSIRKTGSYSIPNIPKKLIEDQLSSDYSRSLASISKIQKQLKDIQFALEEMNDEYQQKTGKNICDIIEYYDGNRLKKMIHDPSNPYIEIEDLTYLYDTNMQIITTYLQKMLKCIKKNDYGLFEMTKSGIESKLGFNQKAGRSRIAKLYWREISQRIDYLHFRNNFSDEKAIEAKRRRDDFFPFLYQKSLTAA